MLLFSMAMAALIPMPVPLCPVASAPLTAVVVTVWLPVAARERLLAPAKAAPFSMAALVGTATTFTATDAPIPSLPLVVVPSAVGWASAVSVVVFCAVSETGPWAVTAAPVGMVAPVVSEMTLIASEPATPTLVAPAPEVAVALSVSPAGLVAETSIAFAESLAFPPT